MRFIVSDLYATAGPEQMEQLLASTLNDHDVMTVNDFGLTRGF
jgi:hypothetical protein